MNFASTRVITADITALVAFYEKATARAASWFTPDFAELAGPTGATLAIGSTDTVPLFAAGSAAPAANRSVILEFLVDDVDDLWQQLAAGIPGSDVVAEPKTMPWGNRSLLVRDPDGNLVNFFTPVTSEARAKFGL
ncbi:VOC family protein [Catenulispora rubra]|uniref:VOC family protein n=1 Tax=Catenulispora rubra TaxID=280293 RepID=UPI0018926DEB|nr:VOC family protein [Catenulispora rubra]